MMRNTFYSLCVTGMLVAGCSSDDTSVSSARDENQLFAGGVSCGVSVITSTNASTNTTSTVDTAEASAAVDCSAALDTALPGPGVVSTGTGTLVLPDRGIAINGALIEIVYRNTRDDFMEADLILHDGNVRTRFQQSVEGSETTSRLDWGIYGASVALSTELRQEGSAMFTGGSFEVVQSEDGEVPAALNTAFEPAIFIDKRSDGMLTDSDEVARIVSGNINITGSTPDWSVIIDVTLEDGTPLNGSYTGSFYELPGQ